MRPAESPTASRSSSAPSLRSSRNSAGATTGGLRAQRLRIAVRGGVRARSGRACRWGRGGPRGRLGPGLLERRLESDELVEEPGDVGARLERGYVSGLVMVGEQPFGLFLVVDDGSLPDDQRAARRAAPVRRSARQLRLNAPLNAFSPDAW
jgi:hypothetical protein